MFKNTHPVQQELINKKNEKLKLDLMKLHELTPTVYENYKNE